MFNALRSLLVGAALAAAMVSVGCNGPQEKMATLEQRNQELLDDNKACQDELAAARAERDKYHDEYMAAKAQLEAIQGQLAEVPKGWQAVPGGAMIAIEGSVLFNSGLAALRKEGKPTLEKIAATIRETYPDKQVLVYGHTDTEPIKKSKWKDNLELSAQRALTVVRELHAGGMDPAKLVAAGCGEYRAVAANETDDGRKKNRRVEIYALDARLKGATK